MSDKLKKEIEAVVQSGGTLYLDASDFSYALGGEDIYCSHLLFSPERRITGIKKGHAPQFLNEEAIRAKLLAYFSKLAGLNSHTLGYAISGYQEQYGFDNKFMGAFVHFRP